MFSLPSKALDDRWIFLILIAASLSVAMWNGLPFLHQDSFGYAGYRLGDSTRSLTPNFVARFLYPLFGLWSLPVINAVVFAFLSVHLRRTYLPRIDISVYVLAVFASFLPFYVGYPMPDVWGLFMVLSLLILLRKRSPIVLAILAFSITTHLAHMALFIILAVATLLLFRGRLANLLYLAAALLGAVLIYATVSQAVRQSVDYPKLTWIFVGSSFLYHHPEVLRVKCEADPGFVLCAHEDYISSEANNPATLLWKDEFEERIDRTSFQEASREFAIFTAINHPFKVVAGTLRTAWNLFTIEHCAISLAPDKFVVPRLEKRMPEFTDDYQRSLQHKGILTKNATCRVTTIYRDVIYFLLIAALALYAIWLVRRSEKDTDRPRIILLILATMLGNALIVGVASGADGRYLFKLFFLLFLILMIISESILDGSRANRDRDQEAPP